MEKSQKSAKGAIIGKVMVVFNVLVFLFNVVIYFIYCATKSKCLMFPKLNVTVTTKNVFCCFISQMQWCFLS